MEPFLTEQYANPSGMHAAARASKTALEAARETVAEICGGSPREVVFTGGGSEGDNLAVKGAAWAARDRSGVDGVVTTGIEHKAVLGACDRLARDGFRVDRIGAHASGLVDLDTLASALDDRTAVVSVMLVNNETGIVQPLDEVTALVRDRAPQRGAAHRRGAGAGLARSAGRRRRVRSRHDFRTQVRRTQGRRRARGPRGCGARAAHRRRGARRRAARGYAERRRDRRPRGGACGHRRRGDSTIAPASPSCAIGCRVVSPARFPSSSSMAIRCIGSRASSTARSPASKPRRCSSCSTSRASTPRRVRRVARARSTHRTCCWRWVWIPTGRARRFASASASRPRTPTSTTALTVIPEAVRKLMATAA